MSRGSLEKHEYDEIGTQLPEMIPLGVAGLPPDGISIGFPCDNSIPIASVCLRDAISAVNGARYALQEVLAHRKWYLEKRNPPSVSNAAFFGRFYADNVALRLYSGGEYLAEAIVNMLEISKLSLKSNAEEGWSTRQIVVGRYLLKEHPTHPITLAIKRLKDSDDWLRTLEYRNAWVHNQPPLIEGMGIQYDRSKRWKTQDNVQFLTFGGGDQPAYSVIQLVGFMRPALFLFSQVVVSVMEAYSSILIERGAVITKTGSGCGISYKI